MQFFGPQPDGKMRMKPAYLPACCKTCRRYDDDDIHDIGFAEPVTIRIRGDFAFTQDRVLIVSDKSLKREEPAGGGFETKPIGKSGWHALASRTARGQQEGRTQTGRAGLPDLREPERNPLGAFQYISEL